MIIYFLLLFTISMIAGELIGFAINPGSKIGFDEKIEATLVHAEKDNDEILYISDNEHIYFVFKTKILFAFKYSLSTSGQKRGMVPRFSKQAKRLDKIFEKLEREKNESYIPGH